jgi:histidinol-phosphatase (PHP family)
MRRDGHIHTPFCPHGTKDTFESYIERALSLGLEEISFTEHAPLPDGFIDTAPTQDSAMNFDELDDYFDEIDRVKLLYSGKIKINAGLEVDYIEGFDRQITETLNKIGHRLDDAILSVHFLKQQQTYHCLDYSPNVFSEMINEYGSLENIYRKYYETLLLSIYTDLGVYKPKRIGHITLVHKFQHRFPYTGDEQKYLLPILEAIKENKLELDYNGAGTAKPLCREPYPPDWVINQAKAMDIPLVYGSDAHQMKELGQGYTSLLIRD